MPSIHLTSALLVALNARSWRLRIGFWIYAASQTVPTLAIREHYLVDLIAAAVPYTLAIQWLSMHYEGLLPTFAFRSLAQKISRIDSGETEP